MPEQPNERVVIEEFQFILRKAVAAHEAYRNQFLDFCRAFASGEPFDFVEQSDRTNALKAQHHRWSSYLLSMVDSPERAEAVRRSGLPDKPGVMA